MNEADKLQAMASLQTHMIAWISENAKLLTVTSMPDELVAFHMATAALAVVGCLECEKSYADEDE